MDLKNKNVLVTGASTGIGKEIAKAFVKKGCNVAIIATSEQRLLEAFEEISAVKIFSEQKIVFQLADLSSFTQTERALSEIAKIFGDIEVLINNAGITKDNLLMKMPEEDFDRVIEVNLKSIYNTCKI